MGRRKRAKLETRERKRLATRAIDPGPAPSIDDQLLAIQGLSTSARRAWAPLGVRDALGIPAVFRAVTLISNMLGTFTLEAWRNGRLMPEQPRLCQRPDPFRTPRDFFRNVGWNLATRGEGILYVGARDTDGYALSVLNLPPHEVVDRYATPRDEVLGLPDWEWRGAALSRRDVVHITFAQDGGTGRGLGPLQLCGAAITVAAEAESWAANYYGGGGIPSVVLSPRVPIDAAEAEMIRAKWVSTPPNTPKVAAEMDVKELSGNAQQAQLAESRLQSVGDVASMFGMPPELLEHGMSGAGGTLQYRTLSELGTDFLRFCLIPGYLEPVEQAFSDLLSRSTIARFNVEEVERADAETRAKVHKLMIDAGVYDAEHAQVVEGLRAGSPQFAPVPPNAALPVIPSEARL